MDTPTCDRCGPSVRAYVFLEINGTELGFCGHHGAEYIPGWEAKGYKFWDLRYAV